MGRVVVRYFAGARAAAGVETEAANADTVGDLIRLLGSIRGDRLAAVLAVSTVLVDGTAARDSSTALADGASVDVLPPFAGG